MEFCLFVGVCVCLCVCVCVCVCARACVSSPSLFVHVRSSFAFCVAFTRKKQLSFSISIVKFSILFLFWYYIIVNDVCKKIIKKKFLDTNKATGPDGVRFVQMSANVIDCHLSNTITRHISKNKYSVRAKTATIRPIFKKDYWTKIEKHQSVSLLNMFSKIYERFLHENLTNYLNTFLSKFISAYRKSYRTNHVLISLTEN